MFTQNDLGAIATIPMTRHWDAVIQESEVLHSLLCCLLRKISTFAQDFLAPVVAQEILRRKENTFLRLLTQQ